MRHYRITDLGHTGGLPSDEQSTQIKTNDLTWYVVQTPPMREFDAEEILTGYGFTVVCPLKHVFARVNRRAKRKRAIQFPLLKGYVLAGFDGTPNWHNFLQKGRERGVVSNIIRFQGKAAPIPARSNHWVDKMRGTINPPTKQTNSENLNHFEKGDMVTIIDGPFEGHKVQIETVSKHKVKVTLSLFGREQIAELGVDSLEEVA